MTKYDFRVDKEDNFYSTRAWYFNYYAPVRGGLERLNTLQLLWCTPREGEFLIETPPLISGTHQAVVNLFGEPPAVELLVRFREPLYGKHKKATYTKWVWLGDPFLRRKNRGSSRNISSDEPPVWLPERPHVTYGRKIA